MGTLWEAAQMTHQRGKGAGTFLLQFPSVIAWGRLPQDINSPALLADSCRRSGFLSFQKITPGTKRHAGSQLEHHRLFRAVGRAQSVFCDCFHYYTQLNGIRIHPSCVTWSWGRREEWSHPTRLAKDAAPQLLVTPEPSERREPQSKRQAFGHPHFTSLAIRHELNMTSCWRLYIWYRYHEWT